MDLKKRKKIRLENYDYSQNGAYFVTVCTAGKKALFWKNVGADIIRPRPNEQSAGNAPLSEYGEIAETAIRNISEHYPFVTVDKYCIMPNHVHMIVFIAASRDGRIISAPTLSTVIGQMKRWASKEAEAPLWQKSFYDEIIRNEKACGEIRKYVCENPSRWEEDEYFV